VRLWPRRTGGAGPGAHPAPGVPGRGALAGRPVPVPGPRGAAGRGPGTRRVPAVLGLGQDGQLRPAGRGPGFTPGQIRVRCAVGRSARAACCPPKKSPIDKEDPMKTMLRAATAAALLGAASLAPALAQETIGTMQVNGTVMTSTGGEFVPAASGEAIQAGE